MGARPYLLDHSTTLSPFSSSATPPTTLSSGGYTDDHHPRTLPRQPETPTVPACGRSKNSPVEAGNRPRQSVSKTIWTWCLKKDRAHPASVRPGSRWLHLAILRLETLHRGRRTHPQALTSHTHSLSPSQGRPHSWRASLRVPLPGSSSPPPILPVPPLDHGGISLNGSDALGVWWRGPVLSTRQYLRLHHLFAYLTEFGPWLLLFCVSSSTDCTHIPGGVRLGLVKPSTSCSSSSSRHSRYSLTS